MMLTAPGCLSLLRCTELTQFFPVSFFSLLPPLVRHSTREDALTKLQNILAQRYTAELLDSQRDDLIDLLKKSIKKGGVRETVLAANGPFSVLFV